MKQVSVIEFGVAGGNGLVALDQIAEKAEAILDVNIHVYGFDTGVGLPKPTDYRDLPSLWVEGAFPMDVGRLKKRLTRAELVLGPVEKTLPGFLASNPAPVGFISFDLDYYSINDAGFQASRSGYKNSSAAHLLLLRRYFGAYLFGFYRRAFSHPGIQRDAPDGEKYRQSMDLSIFRRSRTIKKSGPR